MAGRLYLCATPIGNLGDVSPRLADALRSVDVVYAEDTRRTSRLLAALDVKVTTRSFFVGNERRRSSELTEDLAAGRDVAILTDAGTPGVSDPGVLAVAAARAAGADVVVIPGPSAVTAAVAGSGMVDGPFVFAGFLERKGRQRGEQLADIAADVRPTVVFLSPHRLGADLGDLLAACGPDRQVCVARELTKVHEELWWGTLADAVARWSREAPRGEFTVVVAGGVVPAVDPTEAVAVAHKLIAGGMTPSQAARQAAAQTGVSRRRIYQSLLSS